MVTEDQVQVGFGLTIIIYIAWFIIWWIVGSLLENLNVAHWDPDKVMPLAIISGLIAGPVFSVLLTWLYANHLFDETGLIVFITSVVVVAVIGSVTGSLLTGACE